MLLDSIQDLECFTSFMEDTRRIKRRSGDSVGVFLNSHAGSATTERGTDKPKQDGDEEIEEKGRNGREGRLRRRPPLRRTPFTAVTSITHGSEQWEVIYRDPNTGSE